MWSELQRQLFKYLPGLSWLQGYTRQTLSADLLASVITAILLIPQSLAYAMLAGLPAEAGLYASIGPLMAYALFGSSRALAVGPVAVISLMTAAAIGNLGLTDPTEQMAAAAALAMLSSGFLILFAVVKLGAIANFLSRPVVSAFVTASTVLIVLSQIRHVLGINGSGSTIPELLTSMWISASDFNAITLAIGGGSIALLLAAKHLLPALTTTLKLPPQIGDGLAKSAPAFVVILAVIVTWSLSLNDTMGVAIVGTLPQGAPPIAFPSNDLQIWRALVGPAALISLIGFVESVSVGQSLAARQRESINPDRELYGLGAANLASSMTGGYPVTGGFARSVVNETAGARTPFAGVFTGMIILFVAAFLTPAFHHLPKATLAATILIAIFKLADFGAPFKAWKYSKADGAAAIITLIGVLLLGVEIGISLGVIVSIGLVLQRTTQPHWARIGQVPSTHHFRNVKRHDVIVSPTVISLRIDEALYFANARFLEDLLSKEIACHPKTTDVVLMCSAVNFIDASALTSLQTISDRLNDSGVKLHFSEIKGPVQDRLEQVGFFDTLSGTVFSRIMLP